jgi:hypothetical protein
MLRALSAELLACPFCRQLFPSGEVETCPECGIALKPLAKLPPSHDALAEDPPEVVPPHMVPLPWTYLGRGRGLLAALGLLGLLAFFAPWVQERAPDLIRYSGFDLGIRLRWIWAAGIAFLVMVPLVLSRRSVHAMRGARFAVGFLAGVVLVTVIVRIAFVPTGSTLRPVRYEWGWGLYACGAIALLVIGAVTRFGGSLEQLPAPKDAPSSKPRSPGERPRTAPGKRSVPASDNRAV